MTDGIEKILGLQQDLYGNNYTNNIQKLLFSYMKKKIEDKKFKHIETLNNGNIKGVLFDDKGEKISEGEYDKNKKLKKGIIYYDGVKSLEGSFKYNVKENRYELHGKNCKVYDVNTGRVMCEGEFKNDKLNKGIHYNYDGSKMLKGNFKDNMLDGDNCISYLCATISNGTFKKSRLYSGNAYLKDNLEDEEIKKENKIYTLERDNVNPNIRTLTFHTRHSKIGLNRNITIHIDENNVARLVGDPLTEDEITSIKNFFNNIPLGQLNGFDERFASLYYAIIMNKEEYKDKILIPDACKYNYEENEEVSRTLEVIKTIPQEKRKGSYIFPSFWLGCMHQVNVKIDFDNKIFEIINTGSSINQKVINNLQFELREKFNNRWVVCENNVLTQTVGNCVLASNIATVEREVLRHHSDEYKQKKSELGDTTTNIKMIKKLASIENKMLYEQFPNNFIKKNNTFREASDINKKTETSKGSAKTQKSMFSDDKMLNMMLMFSGGMSPQMLMLFFMMNKIKNQGQMKQLSESSREMGEKIINTSKTLAY